jgi:hypothetical protein
LHTHNPTAEDVEAYGVASGLRVVAHQRYEPAVGLARASWLLQRAR